jgi:hypothetical protein
VLPARFYLTVAFYARYLLCAGNVEVLSVIISFHFLECYPACLLLAAVHSERRTPVRTFTDEIDPYLALHACLEILKPYDSCDWARAR